MPGLLVIALVLLAQPVLAVIIAIKAFLRMGKFPSGTAISAQALPGNLLLVLAALPTFCFASFASVDLHPPALVLGILSLTFLPLLPAFTPLGEIRWLSPLCATLAILPIPALLAVVLLQESHGIPAIIRTASHC